MNIAYMYNLSVISYVSKLLSYLCEWLSSKENLGACLMNDVHDDFVDDRSVPKD